MPVDDRSVLLRIPPAVVEAIDAKRGKTSRNAWIIRVLSEALAPPGSSLPPLGGDNRGSIKTEIPPAEKIARRDRKIAAAQRPDDSMSAPENCDHPKNRRRAMGWGTLCGKCGVKL